MSGHDVAPGLTPGELARAEERCGCKLPPDLADLLQRGVPSGQGFPDWRKLDDKLDAQLTGAVDGVVYDVEQKAFWFQAWGPRPEGTDEAVAIARERLAEVPRLIPVFLHRYLPAEPCE